MVDGGRWRVTSPHRISSGPSGYFEGSFAYCTKNLRALPKLREFFAIPRKDFVNYVNYNMAATVAYFLLEGGDCKHRASFIELLEATHEVQNSPDIFERCFPKIDMETMQAEWEAFVSALVIER